MIRLTLASLLLALLPCTESKAQWVEPQYRYHYQYQYYPIVPYYHQPYCPLPHYQPYQPYQFNYFYHYGW